MDNELILLMQALVKKMYVSLNDFMIDEKVSKRQILYRIDKLNQLLKDKSVSPVVIGSHNELILSNETKEVIMDLIKESSSSKAYFLNKKERLSYMYLMIFINPDYLTLHHFSDSLQVSRSTVLLDFKDLLAELKEFHVEIKNNRNFGYYLVGPELEIRRYMMKQVIYSLAEEGNSRIFDLFIDDFLLDIFDYSKLVIDELSLKYNIRFVEDRLIEFIYIFIFLKTRMLSGINHEEEMQVHIDHQVMRSLKEFEFTQELLKNYKKTDLLTHEDVNYISSWILGISFGNIDEDTKDCVIISDLIVKIMMRFESLSGIHYENREEIFIQLYSHIRPAYYRLLFKLPIFNPLSSKLKDEYKELYHLVEETMKPLSAIFGQEIPEEEVAYLTIHFATIYANHKINEVEDQKTALVVCSNGIGSSAILYSELTNLFPELHFLAPIETSRFLEMRESVDIIFTTNYFASSIATKIPIVIVSPVMTIRERYQVVREVYMLLGSTFTKQPNIDVVMNIVSQHAEIKDEQSLYNALISYFTSVSFSRDMEENDSLRLMDLMEEGIIQVDVEAKDREEAIILSYEPMLKKGYITQGYVEEIIKDLRRLGPYIVITKHIALPHTKAEAGALKTGLGITVLKEPIVFKNQENDPVKYIFSLSATEHERHLQAMSELVDLFGEEEFFYLLDHAKTAKEIYQWMLLHSKRLD